MTKQLPGTIENEEAFNEALGYIAEKVGDISLLLTGKRLPVTVLKLFAHNDGEYEALERLVRQHGQKAEVSSGNSFYVDVDSGLMIADTPISLLGVRRPFVDRPQVGCGDYEVDDFPTYASELLKKQPQFARQVQNAHRLDMVELWHPDFDVLGYVIPKRS